MYVMNRFATSGTFKTVRTVLRMSELYTFSVNVKHIIRMCDLTLCVRMPSKEQQGKMTSKWLSGFDRHF